MHICFLTNEYPKVGFAHGGIGSFIKTLAPELVKKGYKISIIGLLDIQKDVFYEEQGVSIYGLHSSSIKGFGWLINNFILNKKIKEVHAENPITIIESSELGLVFLNKIKTIKYIIRLHGGHHFFAESENRKIDLWKGFQEKRSFIKADAFVAVSEYVKLHTSKFLSFNDKQVCLINYPINTDLFKPLVINIVPYKIVFAGTVCEKKGIRQLIQAFAIVKSSFPTATLEVYGRDWNFANGSSYIEMLKKVELPKLHKYAEDVFFRGPIAYKEIPTKYAEAQVCVFPSHMETQGLVAPEAMAMEKMVIFTKFGPGPETIIDFETGLLCNPLDPNDIANKIIWVFNNQDKSKEIAQKARIFVIGKYNLTTIVNQNSDFYGSLE